MIISWVYVYIQNIHKRMDQQSIPDKKIGVELAELHCILTAVQLRGVLIHWKRQCETTKAEAEQIIPLKGLFNKCKTMPSISMKRLKTKVYLSIDVDFVNNPNRLKCGYKLITFSKKVVRARKKRKIMFTDPDPTSDDSESEQDEDDTSDDDVTIYEDLFTVNYAHTFPFHSISGNYYEFRREEIKQCENLPLKIKQQIRNRIYFKLRNVLPKIHWCEECDNELCVDTPLCRECVCDKLCEY